MVREQSTQNHIKYCNASNEQPAHMDSRMDNRLYDPDNDHHRCFRSNSCNAASPPQKETSPEFRNLTVKFTAEEICEELTVRSIGEKNGHLDEIDQNRRGLFSLEVVYVSRYLGKGLNFGYVLHTHYPAHESLKSYPSARGGLQPVFSC